MIKIYVSHDDYQQNIEQDIKAYQKEHPETTTEEYHRLLRSMYESFDYQLDFFKNDFYFYDTTMKTHIGNYGIDLIEDIPKILNSIIEAMEERHRKQNPDSDSLLINKKEEFIEQLQLYETDPKKAVYGKSEPIIVTNGIEIIKALISLYDEEYTPKLHLQYNPEKLQSLKKTYQKIFS